jgi:transcriptional regulator with XRE-family HTH domain
MTGPQLRQLRDRLNLSLADVSREMGVNISTVCRWQNSRHLSRLVEKAVRHLECERTDAERFDQ